MKAQTVGKSILKTGLAACVLLTTLSSAAGISVDDDGVPTNLSPIGKIPTYHYSIPASQMIELLKKDIDEKRVHLSTTKGSYLDQYIESTENIPNGIQKKGNAFAAHSNGKMCVITINVTVSSSALTSAPQAPAPSMTRNCAMVDQPTYGFTAWLRNTMFSIDPVHPSEGLAALAKAAGVTYRYNPNGSTALSGLRGTVFSSTAMGVAQEQWGAILFNTYGPNAKAQEIVWIVANWI